MMTESEDGRMFCQQNSSHDLYIWSRLFLSKTWRAGNGGVQRLKRLQQLCLGWDAQNEMTVSWRLVLQKHYSKKIDIVLVCKTAENSAGCMRPVDESNPRFASQPRWNLTLPKFVHSRGKPHTFPDFHVKGKYFFLLKKTQLIVDSY